MKKFLTGIVAVMFVVGSCATVHALTVEEIINESNRAAYYQGSDGKADVRMVITDSLGRTREREMTILRIDAPDDVEQKYYVYFDKPNDVKGMSYLVWKHPGNDDDRWLYLPAMDLVRRVAASDKRSSFVGTHFAYEEISGRGPEEDDHTLEGKDDVSYKVKSVPKDPRSVEFSYFVTWIDKENFLPKKAEMYDKNGKMYKTIEALEIKDIEGHPTITKMKATDLNANGYTVSEFTDVRYDVGLKDNVFTERFLRRPPRQYIGQ
ncbi:MAG: outer membrane lipoprotein-sorting protein [Candidatus Tantalella remota]|nr:outer membrane lipoprotein-sorting protein [Candidatus Tantalella remota]